MNGDSVKTVISFVLALVLIALFCAGVLLLTGHYTYGEALMVGFCGTVGGALAPIVVAWFEKLFRRKH